MFRFFATLAVLVLTGAFQPTYNARSWGRMLEMAKRSVGDLTEADLKGKRYIYESTFL
jgi:hypothetical protein